MKTIINRKLDRLWHIFQTLSIIDILFIGGIVQEEGILTIERIVGKNPIYLKFKNLFIEMYSVENEKGCELQWNICDHIKLPTPVYEDDPNEIEFKFVLYSIFNILTLSSSTDIAKVRIESGSALLEKSDNNIIRGIDLGLSSGIVCRFDPFSFDGLQLNVFAGKPGDKLNVDKQSLLIESVKLYTDA